ncbi:uncharacterized protein LOC135488511 [Lineus longissimus]|uniref:uncharacterized protein LOC135488511 n=1 Tax=Lineus longissimus TaxID=88925 RepID=UPI002B4CEA2D
MSRDDCGVGYYFEDTIEQCFPCEHICGNLLQACILRGCQEYWEINRGQAISTETPYKYVSTLQPLDLIIGLSVAAVVVTILIGLIIFIIHNKKRYMKQHDKEDARVRSLEEELSVGGDDDSN